MYRILIIEDHAMNMELMTDLVEAAGWEAVQARDAERGLSLLAEDPLPDLILMDIALPGMDGIEATRVIKADERLGGIPVIAVTASSMRIDQPKLLAAGCSDVMYKPINILAMLRMMRRVLEG